MKHRVPTLMKWSKGSKGSNFCESFSWHPELVKLPLATLMFVIILLCYGFVLLWLVNVCSNFNLIKTEESVWSEIRKYQTLTRKRLTSWSCIYELIDKTFQFLKVKKKQTRSSQAPRNTFGCTSCELFVFVYFWHCEFVIKSLYQAVIHYKHFWIILKCIWDCQNMLTMGYSRKNSNRGRGWGHDGGIFRVLLEK